MAEACLRFPPGAAEHLERSMSAFIFSDPSTTLQQMKRIDLYENRNGLGEIIHQHPFPAAAAFVMGTFGKEHLPTAADSGLDRF